jgi:phenylacetate-CoA ligase
LKRILAEFNVKPEELGSVKADLPILFHYGRSDSSVAYFGAKVRPSDIQEVVMRIPDLIHVVNSFTLYTTEDETMDKLFVVRFEMKRVQNGLARRICRN